MGAIVDAINKAADSASEESLHHYESKIDSQLTNARVKEIRNNIIGNWWAEVGGVNPSSTKATSVVDPIQKTKSKRSLEAKISSHNEEGLFYPYSEALSAYQARNAGKSRDQVKPGAVLPPSTENPAHYIFNQIFFIGRLGPRPTGGVFPLWYQKNRGTMPASPNIKGTPLATVLVDPGRWHELQALLDSIVKG